MLSLSARRAFLFSSFYTSGGLVAVSTWNADQRRRGVIVALVVGGFLFAAAARFDRHKAVFVFIAGVAAAAPLARWDWPAVAGSVLDAIAAVVVWRFPIRRRDPEQPEIPRTNAAPPGLDADDPP